MKGRTRHEAALACVVYVSLLCVAYGNVIFFGKSLIYSDNFNPLVSRTGGMLGDSRFTSANYGKDFVPESAWAVRNLLPTANFHDPGATLWQWEPSGAFLLKAVRDGEMPFWDPYVAGGVPSMANLTPAYFFPPYFFLVLLGNTALLKNLYFLGVALIAGLFTFLFLRRHEVSVLGSLVGGAAFMFCGGISQNIGSFIGQTAACIPVALFATAWFLEMPTRRRASGLAVIYSGAALASFPPVLVQVFGLTIAYVLARFVTWRAPTSKSGRGRTGLRWLAASALSVGLVAWYYAPAFALLRVAPQVAKAYAEAARTALPLRCLYQILSPTLMGGAKVYAQPPIPDPFFLQLPYLGIVAFFLALLPSSRNGPRRVLTYSASVAAILVALKLFGAAPVQWIAGIPGLRAIHFAAYFGIALDFLLALLAGLGLDAFLRGEVRPARALLAVAALLATVLTLRRIAGSAAGEPNRFAEWKHDWALTLFMALAASALVLLGLAQRRRSRALTIIAVALALLLGFEDVRNTIFPRQYRWDVWRHPVPYMKEITNRGDFGRCLTIGALPPNTNSPFGIFSFGSLMAFNPPRIYDLYHRYTGAAEDVFLREPISIPPEPVLDSANIAYLVIRRQFAEFSHVRREASLRGYGKAFEDDSFVVFQRSTLPRYFFTTDYRIRDAPAAIDDVANYAPARQVVTESALSFPPRPNPPGDPAVEIREFRRNRYELSIEAPRPGLLVCSESDFPGWTAAVNGRPVGIVPVNYAFRGVEIPGGHVEIRFRYRPPGLAAGAGVSLLALIVLGALWILPKRNDGPSESAGLHVHAYEEDATAD